MKKTKPQHKYLSKSPTLDRIEPTDGRQPHVLISQPGDFRPNSGPPDYRGTMKRSLGLSDDPSDER